MNKLQPAFWSIAATETLEQLQTTAQGLTTDEARARLTRYGANLLKPKKRSDSLSLLISQFKSPLILILLFATGLSFFLHDPVNALIILTIVVVSGLLGFWQEHSATNAVQKLLAIVQIKAAVLRDGVAQEIPVDEIVPGDIVILNAGDIVPGDCLVQESKDLFIDEATLTGETYPVSQVHDHLRPVSSVFDYLTFGTLLLILHATQDQFRTGWFLESVISASLIVLVIRSRKPFFNSRPSKYLFMATLLVIVVTLILPFSRLGGIFGFTRLSIWFLALIGIIIMAYIITAEMAKTIFYNKVKI